MYNACKLYQNQTVFSRLRMCVQVNWNLSSVHVNNCFVNSLATTMATLFAS